MRKITEKGRGELYQTYLPPISVDVLASIVTLLSFITNRYVLRMMPELS